MKRRRLGQHYLVNPKVIHDLVRFARIQPSERVLEIGTGKGVLTVELAALGESLEAFEVDGVNFVETGAALKGRKVKLRLGDAFEHRPRFDVLVSSLPYSESSRFVVWLSEIGFDRAVVILQEDFARKLLAAPGSRDYRGISAISQISSKVEVLSKVGRDSFSPPPKVGSVIVRLRPRKRLSKVEVSSIQRLFSLRRRQVGSALADLGMEPQGDEFGARRVFHLRPEEVDSICAPDHG
jgi:16S rRNA (adenine1518-N6/adenine1519-N6)-dimethyltransferase